MQRKEDNMSKLLAFFTGLLLSIMLTFNGLLSVATNAYVSNVIYHGIGFIFFGIILTILHKQQKPVSFRLIYFIPGFLGSITIVLNNVVLNALGVTMMIAFTLVGQVVTSLIIDQWGLLGKEVITSKLRQWVGVLIMVAGLIIMVI